MSKSKSVRNSPQLSQSSLDVKASPFQPRSSKRSGKPKVAVKSSRANKQSARDRLHRKSESERKVSPKAVVVAQFKEQTIQYKATVDQLNSDLHKTRGEARHYKDLAMKLKDDLGALLKRSFLMLRDARDKATEYKQQLDELRENQRAGTRETGRLSLSSARSQGSSDLEILSMTSNNSNGRMASNGYEPRIPPMPFADMPIAPWWANTSPPKGTHPLFDELDEKFENAQPQPDLGLSRPRRTIGPSSPSFFEGQHTSPMRDSPVSNVPFDAFDKYLFL